jgi:predicted nucleic acid-binding protein
MIVISDSSPLNYLVLVGQADLLAKLFAQVVIPPAVHSELQRESTPTIVRQWVTRPPDWLTVHNVTVPADSSLGRLGAGEREAIALAEELHADAILIDERDGRRLAERRHLTVIGTLQILDTAAEEGMIDFPTVLAELQKTTFRVSTRLVSLFLERDASRKRKLP